jgi:hypothetical protein
VKCLPDSTFPLFETDKWRDVATAKRFFSNAAKQHGAPRVTKLDGYAASHRAVGELKRGWNARKRLVRSVCRPISSANLASLPAPQRFFFHQKEKQIGDQQADPGR